MAHDLRRSIADRIQEQNTPKTDRFADYMRGEDGETGLPCWADILERFEEEFTDDRDRELIWRALMAEGASRPILVFIYTCVDRPDLRLRIREDVIQLPATIQRAYAAMEPPGTLFEHFHHSAVQMDPIRHRLERTLLAGRIGILVSTRFNRSNETNTPPMTAILRQILEEVREEPPH